MTVKPIQQLGRRELHALLTAVAEAVLANKDNMTTTEMGKIRIMIHDLVNALEAIKDTFYPSPKWTQEQRHKKLRALLATSVKAITATKDDMTEEELVSTRVWVQEALDDIRLEYGIAEADETEFYTFREHLAEALRDPEFQKAWEVSEPTLTQEQKCEKLGVLLATAVEAIVAAKDEMAESDLVEARAMIQETVDELRHQYGIAKDDTAKYKETRRKALESLIGDCAPEDLPDATIVMKIR